MKNSWVRVLVCLIGLTSCSPGGLEHLPATTDTGLNSDLRPDSKGSLRPDSKGERKMTANIEGNLELSVEMVEALEHHEFSVQHTSPIQAQVDGEAFPVEFLGSQSQSEGGKTLRFRLENVPEGENLLLRFTHADLPLDLSRLLETHASDQSDVEVDLDSSALVIALEELKNLGGKSLKEYAKSELADLAQSQELKDLRLTLKAQLKEAVHGRKKLLALDEVKGALGREVSKLKNRGVGKVADSDQEQDKDSKLNESPKETLAAEDAPEIADNKPAPPEDMNAKSQNSAKEKNESE